MNTTREDEKKKILEILKRTEMENYEDLGEILFYFTFLQSFGPN
jgi:hypothetical protein